MSNAPDRRPEDPAPADGSPAATGKRSTDGAEPTSSASHPAPYAWPDDNARMAGAISPGVTTAYGVFFLASAGVLVIVSFAHAALPGLWIALGLGLLARRAWRLRHPGVDPLSTVPSPTGGSAYGPDTRSASVGRWVLLVLCLLLGLVFVASLVDSFFFGAPVTPTSVGSQILLALLALLMLTVARYDLRRIRQLRAKRSRGPQSQ